jgi:uncharacterized protein YdeI (YjbR/CyaY-like superfamily)
MSENILSGTEHQIPNDLLKSLSADDSLIERWNDLTPLARNEWICWTISVKKPETRKKHLERIKTDLLAGKRRPCCWSGCTHRS